MNVAALLSWYRANRRSMPWRDHPDPYAVWVSEIMLQQTRIETVRNYFTRFMERFPTWRNLANAPLQDVLKMWEGLGYYSRARNLRRAAQSLRELPDSLEGWRELPGVGPYTAAAIASVCYGVRAPVVDGNVSRVMARLDCLPDDFSQIGNRNKLAERLQPWIDEADSPGDFNQAMMELGETVCLPQTPLCEVCPLCAECKARKRKCQAEFPVRREKKKIPLRQVLAFLAVNDKGECLFIRRPEEGLLGGLWELPNVPTNKKASRKEAAQRFEELTRTQPIAIRYAGAVTHVFTHFRQRLYIYRVTLPERIPEIRNGIFAIPSTLPLTTATHKALRPRSRKENADRLR